jgi:poly(3-hydroxybutyrate) depolymerase
MLKPLTKTLLLAAFLAPSFALAAPGVDPKRITVSGISAGAQMAHQLHVAYSDVFSGVALVAGGPYGCAEGSLATAMARCIGQTGGDLPIAELAAAIRAAAAEGKVADTANLSGDRAWLFHGASDTVVAAAVSDAATALYAEFLPAEHIRYVTDVSIGHNFPARGSGNPCDTFEAPFVGDCDYDAAGELLTYLYPGLQDRGAAEPGPLVEVALEGAEAAGLLPVAYLFVPPACEGADAACALHLVLHGCAQSSAQLGTDFIEQSGYLPWAAANDIVLAFPQVAPAAANPLGCWDWWGYTGTDYLWRDAAQMKLLVDWIGSMSGGTIR